MPQTVYSQRLSEHIKNAESLLKSGDYVQAGEKVWGALTALINSRFPLETHEKSVKESRFRALVHKYEQTNPDFRTKMRQLGFRDMGELFSSVFGLHKYFYGGTSYNPQLVAKYIEFFIELIKELSRL
jgi:hypothetical protein